MFIEYIQNLERLLLGLARIEKGEDYVIEEDGISRLLKY